ncbi:hypothetical protein MUK42_14102 [Musa troglodytarum]|uniref:Uncharacterized protein n=1 Tax=Musa troglodytarum TaxID=320322 RepID=A0A9E7I7X1_9LILI|nr:hypothetical protein MUK42_14102 [Musa troglodytarum]
MSSGWGSQSLFVVRCRARTTPPNQKSTAAAAFSGVHVAAQ